MKIINSKLNKTLNEIRKQPMVGFNFNGDAIFIDKTNEYYHLRVSGVRKNHCMLCEKRRKTRAHHMIPRRANIRHTILKELRMHICRECEEKVHPENALDSDGIIASQKRKMVKLQDKIRKLRNPDDDRFLKHIDKKIGYLESEVKRVPLLLGSQPKNIYPAQKMYEDRIVELKEIKKNYRKIMRGA